MKISKSSLYSIFIIFLLMLIISIFTSVRGCFIPFLIKDFSINNSIIGIILTAYAMGSIVGSYLAGVLCEKYNHKIIIILGLLLLAVILMLMPYVSNVNTLIITYFFSSIACHFLFIPLSSLVPVILIGFEILLMNLTHAMYGIGSSFTQRIAGTLLASGMEWSEIYKYIGIICFCTIPFVLLMKLPNMKIIHKRKSGNRNDIFKSKILYLLIFSFGFFLSTEAFINNWFINYMTTSYSFSADKSSFYSSIYYVFMATGRIFGSYILLKISKTKGLKFCIICSSLCIALGLLLKEQGIIIISLSGLFTSICFPTFMIIVDEIFSKNASFAIGVVNTNIIIVNTIMTNIIAILNDTIGTYYCFFLAPIFAVLSLILFIISERTYKKSKSLSTQS